MQKSRDAVKFAWAGIDVLFAVLAFLAAVWLAKRHAGLAAAPLALRPEEALFLLLLATAWIVSARLTGLYDDFRARTIGLELRTVALNAGAQGLVAIAILFVVKTQTLSRFFVLVYSLLLLGALGSWRVIRHLVSRRLGLAERRPGRVLIVGAGEVGMRFHETIRANPRLGLSVVGFIADEPRPGLGALHLGGIGDLAGVLERGEIDDVVIALPNGATRQLARVVDACEAAPVRVSIIPDYFEFLRPRFEVARFGPFPLLSIRSGPLEQACWRLLKRAFDLSAALLAFLLVFSWLWPLLALLIKATSPGPVFFRQERWGEKNRPIRCWKFRTMARGSLDVDENGRYQQARRDDPRVTPFGRFLRRSNLDELPQFINVLKGEMSLVGPRPHPTPMNLEARSSIPGYSLRHLVKPGITGWAQVNGFRGETCDPGALAQRVKADIWYIENWSFRLDLKILCLSAWTMLRGDPHAY
jgi:putative colanic acid biosynthesis UDP-glucose lipid carrier transferase